MRSTVLVMAILCGCNRGPELGVLDRSIVGGQAENGYAPVGYLMVGNPLSGPDCGVTVIASNAAVTAAHCIYYHGGTTNRFGVGLGAVGSGPAYPATQLFVHPQYDPNSTNPQNPRYHHDVAVLLFNETLPVTPAKIAATSANESARYIGYGRVTAGGESVTAGYTGERKSTLEQVTSQDDFNIFTTGVGGGLCWGDSGGPLMADGGNTIVGVLSDFNQVFDCHVGNQMIFTELAAESSFIQHALSCAGSTDASCVQPPLCQYRCVDYSYAPGQCYKGWSCATEGCLNYIGTCPSPVTGACTGLTAWDPNRPWYNYTVGEQHIGSNQHRYTCKNVAYCIYDPTGSTGTYGWTDNGPC